MNHARYEQQLYPICPFRRGHAGRIKNNISKSFEPFQLLQFKPNAKCMHTRGPLPPISIHPFKYNSTSSRGDSWGACPKRVCSSSTISAKASASSRPRIHRLRPFCPSDIQEKDTLMMCIICGETSTRLRMVSTNSPQVLAGPRRIAS